MHTIEQLHVNDQFMTTVEITGPEDATECIVFSHGFGVERDARGLFTQLVTDLSKDYVCIQFDYNHVGTGGDLQVESFVRMKETLRTVVGHYTRGRVHVVGHSMGCLLAAECHDLFDGTVTLLTPPLEPLGSRLENYLRARPATQELDNGGLAARRSDGSTTLVSKNFFTQLTQLDNPISMLSRFSQDVSIVLAQHDEVVGYFPDLAQEISGARVVSVQSNHDLEGSEIRRDLLAIIQSN